jgi:hypothetical protein
LEKLGCSKAECQCERCGKPAARHLGLSSGNPTAPLSSEQPVGIIWRNQIANGREHRSTRRVVRLMFESEEKKELMAMNPTPYDTDEVFSRNVPPDFHIQYETNRYSVPWTLVGMVTTIRVNNQTVKVYYNERFITAHPTAKRWCWEPAPNAWGPGSSALTQSSFLSSAVNIRRTGRTAHNQSNLQMTG